MQIQELSRISKVKTLSLEFHEYSRIFKRPIPASYFKVFQALGITWIFKNIQAHKSWTQKLEVSRNSKLYFPAGDVNIVWQKWQPFTNAAGKSRDNL